MLVETWMDFEGCSSIAPDTQQNLPRTHSTEGFAAEQQNLTLLDVSVEKRTASLGSLSLCVVLADVFAA